MTKESLTPGLNSDTLSDSFGRRHNYLRISLIERCNLRCTYCMPEEGIPLRDKAQFMSHEEVLQLAGVFVKLGVDKIRLTGGEPLIKKGFETILNGLAELPVSLAITTNGILLDKYWQDLLSSGLKNLNISLDSLHPKKFESITRRDQFDRVWNNIRTAQELGFNVRLNAVLMRGVNDDEISDFIELTRDQNLAIRFIEFMPFDGNQWDWSKKVSYEEILNHVRMSFGPDEIIPETTEPNGTSRNFRINGFAGTFGIISSVTNPFCDTCNRIRLTADGKIKNCLFSNSETDLLTPLRHGENVEALIRENLLRKFAERGGISSFNAADFSSKNRAMTAIGG